MIKLTKENFEREIENKEALFVIDLYAEWCYPCKMLAPILDELEAENPSLIFAKINVDDEPELASMFKVQSIPMIAFVKNNTFLDFTVGVVPKDELLTKIKENI